MTGSHRSETRSGRDYAKLLFATLLLAAVASVASSQRAASQRSPTVAAKPVDSEVAPRGQREVKDIAYGDWKKLFTSLDEIDKVTADDVKRVAAQYFTQENRTVAVTYQPAEAAQ